MVRGAEKATFEKQEAELLTTIDELAGAIGQIKSSMSFLQVKGRRAGGAPADVRAVAAVLSKIVNAAWVTSGDRRRVAGFLQEGEGEDDDLSLRGRQEPAPSTGGIVETLEEMKEKAEESLSDIRQTETKAQQSFALMEQSLNSELKNGKEKKSDAASTKETKTEELGKASGDLAETEKTKKADETYLASLTLECQQTAEAWATRQSDAKEEMGVIEKAKEILTSGVKVFVQVDAKTKSAAARTKKIAGDDDEADDRRTALVQKLKGLASKYHSFALMEMVTAASSDPFVKIRGLIEDMISKLIAEAEEEATQKAFCDEEIGKSKASQAEKTATLDKLTSRLDQATSTKASLEEAIKELESEVAEIDASQAAATKMRSEENETYLKSSKDFKDSAEATEKAIVVLKEYYGGALIQINTHKRQPAFGSAKSDAGSSIISILEMAAEDFTSTYTEIETQEMEAAKAYEKMTEENKVAKAAKFADAKAKASEVKSLSVTLENGNADKGMVTKELDAVLAYLDKLKPQCETKAMFYEEKKARREAEIEGLKEALQILDGTSV